MIEKYYEEELKYIYESGREFSKIHPDRAQFLNIDNIGDRDPYIERLFEGFAFLTARIREKIEDSYPELIEGVINLLWPSFVHEIPSLSIVEFTPRKGHLHVTRVIDKGIEIVTHPVGENYTVCKFTTTQKVVLNPITIKSVEKNRFNSKYTTLTLNFSLESEMLLNKLMIFPLRLHIHSEMPSALLLHELMTRHTVQATLKLPDGKVIQNENPYRAITPGGFTCEESILPGKQNCFQGYELLLEYFVFPEKFLCFDINGFDLSQIENSYSSFSLTFEFDKEFPGHTNVSSENFRLHCTPVVNIFQKVTEPVAITGLKSEYQVKADSNDNSFTVYKVLSVIGVNRLTGERSIYHCLYDNKDSCSVKNKTYSCSFREGITSNQEMSITIDNGQPLDGEVPEENLSINALCTNGTVPRQLLRIGDISIPGKGMPDFVSCTNIIRPTVQFFPSQKSNYQWVFISHLSLSSNSLSDINTIKNILKLYDWSRLSGRAKRIDAIQRVALSSVEMAFNNSIVKGIEYSIDIDESAFSDNNDLHLFGSVLSEFIAQHVSINSFVELVFITKPSDISFRWNPSKGTKWPI